MVSRFKLKGMYQRLIYEMKTNFPNKIIHSVQFSYLSIKTIFTFATTRKLQMHSKLLIKISYTVVLKM